MVARSIIARFLHSAHVHKGELQAEEGPFAAPRGEGLKQRRRQMSFFATHIYIYLYVYTLPKTNMEPENGPLEDYFPLQPSGFQVPC